MKILYINDYKKGGGAEVMCNITNKLFSNSKIIYLEKLIAKNKFLRILNFILFNPLLYIKVKSIIKKYNPDIIHLHNYNLSPITILLAIKGYKTVQTIHSPGQICPSSWGVYRKNYKKCNLIPKFSKCMKNCFFDKPKIPGIIYYFLHRFISNLRKKYIKYFIFPSNTLKIGFKNNEFKNLFLIRNPIPFNIEKKYNRENISKENIILYVGKIIELKGVDILVKALKKLKKNYKFIFVGEGKLKDKLIKETQDDKRFIFLGEIEHEKVINYYKKSKILVVPSIWFDNFPTTILEGLYNNCIVLGSNRGGIPEILYENLVIDLKDKNYLYLTKKIEDIIDNYKTYLNISLKNKEIILKNTEEKYKKDLEKLYKIIINNEK